MNELEQVEIQIETAKKIISTRDDYVKLSKNRLFKNIIEKGYFQEEAARLVMAKANMGLNDHQQARIDNMISGVGSLANYFEMIMRRGNEMEQALSEHEQTREEILAEEIA